MHYGVMPTTLFRSDHKLVQRIVALVVSSIELDAMHDDPYRRFKSDRSLDQRFEALVVLEIKLDAIHDDFMSKTKIGS